jgi:hypothetical protein
MGGIAKAIMGKPKAPEADPQIARDLAAARATEAKRTSDMKAKKDEETAQSKLRKRGRRSLFAANNQGSGFDEMAEKKKTLS